MICFNQRLAASPRHNTRHGTTIVELAVVLPVFLVVIFAVIEFGHAYMTVQLINSAARVAARIGVTTGYSSADVITKANEMLASGIDSSKAVVSVKDGSDFDNVNITPEQITATDYALLDDIEISNMAERQLFIVRIEIPYDQITLIPGGGWLRGLTLSGQAVMRHE